MSQRRITFSIGLCLVMICSASTVAQQSGAELEATIDSIANEPIEAGRVAGMSIAVVRGNETLVSKAYGMADLELDVPTPPNAVYEIGSVTKQFTAVAALMLVDQGKLSLDDDLSEWFPDYPLHGRSIPVHRLFDHTSGIMGYTEMPVFQNLTKQDLPSDSLVSLFAAEPFVFEPGEASIYNNSAYFLLGKIIEKASGQTYEEFVEEHLFAATGMTDSHYCHKDELTPRMTSGYQPGPDGLRPADYLDHTWPYAAGSLCSTTADLVRWNLALHGDGEGGELLSAESYRSLITPGTLNDGTRLRYAKGLAITDRDGQTTISHGGGIFGYVSHLVYYPEEQLSVVALINTAGGASPGAITSAVADAVFGPPAEVVSRGGGGDLSRYPGTYRGAGRGQRTTVTVRLDDGVLYVRMGQAPREGQSVRWIGGTTFAAGPNRYTFVTDSDGGVEALQVDLVMGLLVLERVGN